MDVLGLVVASIALNSAGLDYFGGRPRLMQGEHPTVRMVRERVTLDISSKTANVRCRYVFRNEGKACDVVMGFPDEGYALPSRYQELVREARANGQKPPPVLEFGLRNFRAFVDGTEVSTKIEAADMGAFHTKHVHFGAWQTRLVEDRYVRRVDRFEAFDFPGYDQRFVSYILRTGATWKGPISESVIVCRFHHWPHPMPHWRIKDDRVTDEDKRLARLGFAGVRYVGASKPVVRGNRLIFRLTNFKPNAEDDLQLSFDFHRRKVLRAHRAPKGS